jgi:hypothetical protein
MHDDLKRRLRDEVDAELGTRPQRNLSDALTRGRRKRLALRLTTTMSMVVVGTALVAGGLSIGRELSSDEARPPANPDEIGTPMTERPALNAMLWDPAGPRRYFVDPDGNDATPLRVTFQGFATEGWMKWFGAVKYLPGDADGFTGLSITTVSNLVSDGCGEHTALDPPVGPTVDDLAVALSQLAPFEVTAPPTDVTLFGYQGKHLELTVPELTVRGGGQSTVSKNIAKFTDCVDGELHSWISPINDRSFFLLGNSSGSPLGAFNAYQVPGQTEEFWILDVEGTRLVLVSFDSPQSPAADVAERDAVFDSMRIELTPETAVDYPGLTTTFVSPRYGYSFKYHDRGGLQPATGDDRFDNVETGLGAYFSAASTQIPDGVSIDDRVDEYLSDDSVSPRGCGVPRSKQAEITIDGQPGRIAECPNQIEATVVAGGRLYLFILEHDRPDARAFFDAWVDTIDLTPATATVP